MKKTHLARTLAMLILLSQLAACGTEPTPSEETTAADTTTAETTAETTTEPSRENTPDSLPDNLNFENASVRISYRGDEVTKVMEMEGDDTGDIVAEAVYNRNLEIEERLGVKLEFFPGNEVHDPYMKEIGTILNAGDDAYDIIGTIQWLSIPQANQGLYQNLHDAPYIDYNQPWWNTEYMDAISAASGSRPLLSGDISIWQMRHMSCMYFNKRIYTDTFGNADDQYQIVLDGKWTYDTLHEQIAKVYRDVNGDGITNEGDVLGISAASGTLNDHYSYTAGLRLTERDKNGHPVLIADQTRNVEVMETLYDLFFATPGVIYFTDSGEEQKACLKFFQSGQMLYYGNRFLITDSLREMEDPYGMIPYPKLNEEQEDYLTLVHDGTTLFAIPYTCKKIDIPCAVLEAMCAENYRTVTPAYYEIALKTKYSQDAPSAQMIDLIHGNNITEFIYANNYILSTSVKLGTIARTMLGYRVEPTRNYMSTYDSIKTSAAADIAKLIETTTGK